MDTTHQDGCDPLGVGHGSRLSKPGPLSRVIDASLDLAWMEAAGRTLETDEARVLDLCDELWSVRADIARSMREARDEDGPRGH
ncbi:hypothetical protein C0Z10_01215 [Acidipropionibacterium jensenii]|uniref:Uncharacterized protein n=1 Tax=Acidipropionibacterium jensenii TaxID=1749 RepID=A0A3Q9UHY7_9ACTN|nr:hypothetical protein [Acidipropionibacterium jensenii]AZZ38592.1 hypothetical protein C0Z10_01215 [Acidipropionibacterium jensenii]